jgi:probable rRNA maturation factor
LDPYRETILYLVHGLLHLVGYNDLEPKDKAAMRRKEKSCMRKLDQLKMTE